MSVGAFTDRGQPPSAEQIAASLDDAWPLWQTLSARLQQDWRAAADLRFYGTNYGWAARYRGRGRLTARRSPTARRPPRR